MKILEGGLPEDKAWRALVLLAPEMTLGIEWQLALGLIRANYGELVAAIIVPGNDSEILNRSRTTLQQARRSCEPDDPLYTVVIQDRDYQRAAHRLVHGADIDLLIASADLPNWQSLGRMPCSVAIVRGEAYNPLRTGPEAEQSPSGQRAIRKILVPTSGGPNTANALSFLLPLANKDVEVTAFYVAPGHMGPNEEALGKARLRQTLNYIDAGEAISQKLSSAPSVTSGIINEANKDYDLVMIGASLESSLDRALFGNIPEAVVRECQTPVIIVREPSGSVLRLMRRVSWAIQPIIPRMNLRERTQAYVRIRRGARPNTDFYVLIGLAAGIAALGLLANSAAVVIGAMLVAPLMSPIAGSGLAIVLGDPRFLRLTLGAILRGALLALLMGFLIGLIPLKDPMTQQILSRTQPTLLDVGVALLSGMAVAYALCRTEATAALPGVAIAAALVPPLATAGITLANGAFAESSGALLLFLTNFVAISSAAALIFLILGFRPTVDQKQRQAIRQRTAQIALASLIIIIALVGWTTYRLARASAAEINIRQVAESGVQQIMGASLAEINIGDIKDNILVLDLVVRSPQDIPHSKVVDLQEYIATQLQREVESSLTVIRTTELDPFLPPTYTPTPTPSNTPTPGPTSTTTPTPSSTATQVPSLTPTNEPTITPMASETPMPTEAPTITPIPSPTRRLATVDAQYGLNLRQEPSAQSELLKYLGPGTEVILLDGNETNDEGDWQEITYQDQIGWVLAQFLVVSS